MRSSDKRVRLIITDDYNPNLPVPARTIFQNDIDVLETVNTLKSIGIERTRESIYLLWKTPFRSLTKSWWVNPDTEEKLQPLCPEEKLELLHQAFEKRTVHVTIKPIKF